MIKRISLKCCKACGYRTQRMFGRRLWRQSILSAICPNTIPHLPTKQFIYWYAQIFTFNIPQCHLYPTDRRKLYWTTLYMIQVVKSLPMIFNLGWIIAHHQLTKFLDHLNYTEWSYSGISPANYPLICLYLNSDKIAGGRYAIRIRGLVWGPRYCFY